ncbi:MAG TPA: hypothetical protein VN414_10775 [Methanosarcina sp.]|nr:hypothetical protein [Methanosarcina sp.]
MLLDLPALFLKFLLRLLELSGCINSLEAKVIVGSFNADFEIFCIKSHEKKLQKSTINESIEMGLKKWINEKNEIF